MNLKFQSFFKFVTRLMIFLSLLLFVGVNVFLYKLGEFEALRNEIQVQNGSYDGGKAWKEGLTKEQISMIYAGGSWEENIGEVSYEDDYSNMKLVIPKIGLNKVIKDTNGDSDSLYYRVIRRSVGLEGVFPGKSGKTMLGGHSSAPKINPFRIDPFFRNLYKVEKGDLIFVQTDRYIYIYKTSSVFEGKKGENVNGILDFTRHNGLILHTCPLTNLDTFGSHLHYVDAKLLEIVDNDGKFNFENYKEKAAEAL